MDVMAPGEDVKSVGAFNGSIIVSGTSISAPHVVGVASVIWGKDKKMSARFVKDLILNSANKKQIKKSFKGILDANYALEIYDTFKKEYKSCYKDESNDIIDRFNNNKPIKKIENNYVTGTWSYEGHKSAANSAGKYNDLTSVQIEILKLGAIYPDQKFAKMTVNPQWHTAPVDETNNYISNYRCAALIAQALKKGKSINSTNVKRPKDMKKSDYNTMIKQVSGIKWTKNLLGGHKVTDAHKGYFAIGMALHAITDAFAHQAYMKNKDGKWKHLAHTQGNDTCDNYQYSKYKNRFNCAKSAAEDAVSVYCLKDTPDHWEFVVDYKDFKLKRLEKYTKNQETYNENFGDMNIIKKGSID